MFKRVPAWAAAASLAVTLFAADTGAQGWFGDDGMASVPCCQPVSTVNIPQFPPFQIKGQYCCLRNCALEASFPVQVITTHFPVTCDYAIISITVFPSSTTAPGFSGFLLAKYARTWLEPTPTGAPPDQVWRFLVNGPLSPTAGATPCPVPPHSTTPHFTGHIDYACQVNAAGVLEFRMAMNLNHLAGCISHNAFSAAPLAGAAAHLDRSYHLFAPGTFVCQNVPEPTGAIGGEALRSTWIPGFTCLGEARVIGGGLATANTNCLCLPGTTGPIPWVHQNFKGSIACAGITVPWFSLPIGGPLPPLPTGFATLPLGSWTGPPTVFPGTRDLAIHFGLLKYGDTCNPNILPYHVVSGVSTSGVPVVNFTPTPPLPPFKVAMDLESSILYNGIFGPWSLGWGTLNMSRVVWNLNL